MLRLQICSQVEVQVENFEFQVEVEGGKWISSWGYLFVTQFEFQVENFPSWIWVCNEIEMLMLQICSQIEVEVENLKFQVGVEVGSGFQVEDVAKLKLRPPMCRLNLKLKSKISSSSSSCNEIQVLKLQICSRIFFFFQFFQIESKIFSVQRLSRL